ncbi:MAG: hypothetical protein LBF34_01395 [Puniceicoccales bacterium]|jgi:hypothetical protein|nr:hypothetical protein [Puniceicoccales bacterium]
MRKNKNNKRTLRSIILGASLMGAFPGTVLSIYGSASCLQLLSKVDSKEELSALFRDIYLARGRISAEQKSRLLALYGCRNDLEYVVSSFCWMNHGKNVGPIDPKMIDSIERNILIIFEEEEFIRSLVEHATYIDGPNDVSGVNIEKTVRQIIDQAGEMYSDDDEPEKIKAALMRKYPAYVRTIDFVMYEVEHRYDDRYGSTESYILNRSNPLELQSLREVKRISILSRRTILAIIERIGGFLMNELPDCGALISLATKIKDRFQVPYIPECAPIEWDDLGGQQLPPKAQALKILLKALLDTIAKQNPEHAEAIIDSIEAEAILIEASSPDLIEASPDCMLLERRLSQLFQNQSIAESIIDPTVAILKNTFPGCEATIDFAIQIIENELLMSYGFFDEIFFPEMQASEALWRALSNTVLQGQEIKLKIIEGVSEILMEEYHLFKGIIDLATHPGAMDFMIKHILKIAAEGD